MKSIYFLKLHFSVLDDYYILYTILYHDFNIGVVSRDLFRDHLFHLDSQSRVDFQRWQASHQFILESFTPDNIPVFKVIRFPYVEKDLMCVCTIKSLLEILRWINQEQSRFPQTSLMFQSATMERERREMPCYIKIQRRALN